MISPTPHKKKCPKCGYSKIAHPNSDVLSVGDMVILCPKCKTLMKVVPLGAIEKMFSILSKK